MFRAWLLQKLIGEPSDEMLDRCAIASLSVDDKSNIDWWCITDEQRATLRRRCAAVLREALTKPD